MDNTVSVTGPTGEQHIIHLQFSLQSLFVVSMQLQLPHRIEVYMGPDLAGPGPM